MKEFKEKFSLFNFIIHKGRDKKLRLVFEKDDDLAVHKKLLEFQDEFVILTVVQDIPAESSASPIGVQGKFEVFKIDRRKLRNGSKLSLVFEQLYEKGKAIEFLNVLDQDLIVTMTPTERTLPFENDDDDSPLPEDLNIDVDKIAKGLPDIKRGKK